MMSLCHIVISLMAAVARSPMSNVSLNSSPPDPPRAVVVWVSESFMTGDGGFPAPCGDGGPELVSPHLLTPG